MSQPSPSVDWADAAGGSCPYRLDPWELDRLRELPASTGLSGAGLVPRRSRAHRLRA